MLLLTAHQATSMLGRPYSVKVVLAILLAGLSSAAAKAVSSPPPPKPPIARNPNPPSPPGSYLPLPPDNCDLVLSFNTTSEEYVITPYRQSFRLTNRTSWSAIATGVGNVSRLERFINDTRDALALVFQVRCTNSIDINEHV